MLSVPGGDDDEPSNRAVARVPDGMGDAPRYEDEGPCAELELAVAELERRLSIADVEDLVGVRVEVRGKCGARREQPNLDDV